MGLDIFLLLPEEDSILEYLEKDEIIFDKHISDIIEIIKIIRKKDGIKLYYDSNNIINFFTAFKEWTDGKYLSKEDSLIRTLLPKSSIDINTKPTIDNECIYVLWNYDELPRVRYCSNIIAEITENKIKYSDYNCLLININEHIKVCRQFLLSLKDAKHLYSKPFDFVQIPFVTSKNDFDLWLSTNCINEFSLLDKTRFSRTKHVQQGQTIFMEIRTGYFWYLDNFHKNEYEVFNQNGEHIGVANLGGTINAQQKVAGRVIEI